MTSYAVGDTIQNPPQSDAPIAKAARELPIGTRIIKTGSVNDIEYVLKHDRKWKNQRDYTLIEEYPNLVVKIMFIPPAEKTFTWDQMSVNKGVYTFGYLNKEHRNCPDFRFISTGNGFIFRNPEKLGEAPTSRTLYEHLSFVKLEGVSVEFKPIYSDIPMM